MSMFTSAQSIIDSLELEDVLEALAEIDADNVPPKRRSRTFCVEHGGRHYPPKLVLSFATAFRYADDPEMQRGLGPEDFAGGPQSNEALRGLGFAIVECRCGGTKANVIRTDSRAAGPVIARVVVDGKAAMNVERAVRCLSDVFDTMRKAHENADVVITPGGFIELDLHRMHLPLGWDTPTSALSTISREAGRNLGPVLASLAKSGPQAIYLTLGIDCILSDSEVEFAVAELVATIDLANKRVVRWTGKSYPTSEQEENLLHVTELSTHLQEIGKWRCLVLGCHDLNMLSPRSIANRDANSRRGKRADELIRLAKAFRPEVVLQHPHTTDTPNIWMGGWAGVRQMLRPAAYASGICYFRPESPKQRRADLSEVLSRTKLGNVVDYVWSGAGKVKRSASN